LKFSTAGPYTRVGAAEVATRREKRAFQLNLEGERRLGLGRGEVEGVRLVAMREPQTSEPLAT
jgi:hypothetical protein